jgi:hypothetical protein
LPSLLSDIAAARPARRLALGLLAASALFASVQASAQSPGTFVPRDETPEEFPEGPGRDETFYSCTACHGFKIVAQQGLNRRQWEESLDLMVSKHKMNPLEGDDRKVVLDYLEKTYPPRTPAGGRDAPNPFLRR